MNSMNSRNMTSWLTIIALVVGSIGIGILWAAGIDFPFYPPPGIVVLLAGAVFMALSGKRWAPAVGAFMGLFVIVGFLISPTGIDNLTGEDGTSVAVGTVIQLVGVLSAFVAGSVALRQSYRDERVT